MVPGFMHSLQSTCSIVQQYCESLDGLQFSYVELGRHCSNICKGFFSGSNVFHTSQHAFFPRPVTARRFKDHQCSTASSTPRGTVYGLVSADSMHAWGLAENANCECCAPEQTADHIINGCQMFRPPTGEEG